MVAWLLAAILLLPLVLGCSRGAPATARHRVVSLPSGGQVDVISIDRMTFAQSGSALMLKYQTDLNMDDTLALQVEANLVWQVFRPTADSAKVPAVILSAHSPPSGEVVSRRRMHNFIYQKDSAGTWVPLVRGSSR